tara:strand:+ start:11 stop:361 length:351 start_codon:yes stop_codon:yes gene_type:complete
MLKICKDKQVREFITIKINSGFDSSQIAMLLVKRHTESVLENIKNKSYNQLINTAKKELLDSGFMCLEFPDWEQHILDCGKLIKETQKILIEKSKNKFLDKTEADVKKFWEQKGGK